MKKFKKILSLALAMMILITALPVLNASAGGDEVTITTDVPYDMWIGYEGEIVRFSPEEDGWYSFYTVGDYDTYATLYNSTWEQIAFCDDTEEDVNFLINVELYAGYTYYLEVFAYMDEDQTAQFQLNAVESVGAVDVEITKEPDTPTVIEGYEEDTISYDGLEAVFTLSDGTTVDWSYDDYDTVNGSYVHVEHFDDGTGHYYIDITCEAAFTRYYYTTVEYNVDYITYDGPAIEYYENSNGYYDESLYQYFYYYDLPEEGTITVHFTDGTSETGNLYEKIAQAYPYYDDNQISTPWLTGNENYVYLHYLGETTEIPVNILPCPFVNVTVNSAPTREYIFGDDEYFSVTNNPGEYWLYPDDFTGLSFTVEYEDGTTQTFTDEDFDTDSRKFDGYLYELSVATITGAGTIETTLNCKGYHIKYDVTVLESPIADIEILKDCDKTEYENYYYPILDGMELKLTYTDGTYDVVTVGPENTSYGFNTIITVGGYNVNFDVTYDDFGEKQYVFSCFGTEEVYEGITFTETRTPDNITVDKVTPDGDGMIITVDYQDGTTETLTFDMVDCFDYGDGDYEGFAITENGLAYYCVTAEYVNDKIVGYTVYFLDEYIYVDAPAVTLGDVNDDGDVNILDATFVQMYVAKYEVENFNVDAADVDPDNEITIRDATAIQMYVSKFITEF